MRVAIGVAYDGSPFEGWQSQPSRNTVQDRLEAALSEIAAHPIRVTAAGRTDAGVHATAQVAHFDTQAERPAGAWVRGTNAHLPGEVAVQWACNVAEEFHARYAAASRTYSYVLYNHPVRPSVCARKVGWFHLPLDLEAMRAGAECILGEHDFSAFRSAECQAKSPVRRVERAVIERRGDYLVFQFTANAFLHHMVRNLIGCLVYVGKGAQSSMWLSELLEARDRSLAAPTFGPEGLYLSAVTYPARWQLPAFSPMLAVLGLE